MTPQTLFTNRPRYYSWEIFLQIPWRLPCCRSRNGLAFAPFIDKRPTPIRQFSDQSYGGKLVHTNQCAISLAKEYAIFSKTTLMGEPNQLSAL